MVSISCISKFHSFSLAEQLEKHGLLSNFYTTYYSKKNSLVSPFIKRIDNEQIPLSKVSTNLPIALSYKVKKTQLEHIKKFDRWVSKKVIPGSEKIFIGWSGMSLKTIKTCKRINKLTILERGSSHIEHQLDLLEEEYKLYGKHFNRNQEIVDRELEEYEIADFISVPSQFAKQSFIDRGMHPDKLICNAYGCSSIFKAQKNPNGYNGPLIILYLGTLSIQKGIRYLMEALDSLDFDYEAWFIGTVHEDMNSYLQKVKNAKIKLLGYKNHVELQTIIPRCHVAVQPSIQEGLSMVIPQILSCGIPVIASKNSGGEDVITENKNGFIVPIRTPEEIAMKLDYYHQNRPILESLRKETIESSRLVRSWDDYGDSYSQTLKKIVENI